MKKWFGFFISLLLILGMILGVSSFSIFKKTMSGETKAERYRIILTQDEEKKGETDPHLILVLKEIQKKLDEWLKSLNERIESEDITRFEVRFLEILRNILEWIKEKVDAKIESSEKGKPIKKEKRGIFRETYQEVHPFSKIG
jgi:tRNA A22 N-methylase